MSHTKWIALLAASLLVVGFASYPVVAGEGHGSSSCSSNKAVASVQGQSSCGSTVASADAKGGSCRSTEGQVASVDGKSCSSKANAVASVDGKKSCGSGAHTVASADGKKCCPSKAKAVASADGKKSCQAGKHQGDVLLSVDAEGQAKEKGDCCGTCKKSKGSCPDPAGAKLQGLLAQIEHAEKAVKNGNQEKALAHLADARKAVKQVAHHMMHHGTKAENAQAKHAAKESPEARFANSKCPIMGKRINPEKVKPALVRQFDGKQVAFCCGGCPRRWDKLSQEEKARKLAQSK